MERSDIRVFLAALVIVAAYDRNAWRGKRGYRAA
jgi:hypothetical protein